MLFVAFRPAATEAGEGASATVRVEPGPRPAARRGARLTVSVSEPGLGARLIELRGELDIDGARTVLAEVTPHVVKDAVVVLDAGTIDFLDSGGMHALLVLARIARTRGARLRLANPSPPVRQLLTRTQADRVIDVRADVIDALEH